MGFTLAFAKPPVNTNTPLLNAIKEAVKAVEYLATVWEGTLEQSVIQQMVRGVAQAFGYQAVGDPSRRKNFQPPDKYLTEVKTGKGYESTFTFVTKDQGKITLILVPDVHGAQSMTCPSCGASTKNKRPAVAHSIIPQEIWKQTITDTLDQFYVVIESGSLTKPAKDTVLAVRSFSSESGQPSGQKVDGKFRYGEAANKAIYKALFAKSLIMSTYAAADNAGKQCGSCEAVQANASLLQRLKLERDGGLPATFNYDKGVHKLDPQRFIGLKFLADAAVTQKAERASGLKAISVEEVFRRKTLAQISRFLLGIEKVIDAEWKKAKNKPAPLLALLIDHWDEFVWTFRTHALKQAGVKYSGKIG